MERRNPLTAVLAAGAVEAAPRLLGAVLCSDVGGEPVCCRITEVEAYREDDPASHTFRGPTPRTAVMFGPPGRLYVYFVYGMHWAANVSCGPVGRGEAVLIRAGEVVAGLAVARARRPGVRKDVDLARGPARLAGALGLDRGVLGVDLLDPTSPVRLTAGVTGSRGPGPIERGPRVGVTLAAEVPWRWWLAAEPSVSPYRTGGRRRRNPPRTDVSGA